MKTEKEEENELNFSVSITKPAIEIADENKFEILDSESKNPLLEISELKSSFKRNNEIKKCETMHRNINSILSNLELSLHTHQ